MLINKLIFWRKKSIKQLTKEQIKSLTKILIIDDEEPKDLRELLRKEGWTSYYIKDLDSLSNKKLEESQVLCIDIMGVGTKLREKNGMGIVKHIKEKYPEKKIILYSSVSNHDIFEDALDYVDRRIPKQSSLVPFISAIEEMATNSLSWSDAVMYGYEQIKPFLKEEIAFEDFKTMADNSVVGSKFDAKGFASKTGVAINLADKVAKVVSVALKAHGI